MLGLCVIKTYLMLFCPSYLEEGFGTEKLSVLKYAGKFHYNSDKRGKKITFCDDAAFRPLG